MTQPAPLVGGNVSLLVVMIPVPLMPTLFRLRLRLQYRFPLLNPVCRVNIIKLYEGGVRTCGNEKCQQEQAQELATNKDWYLGRHAHVVFCV